MCIPIHNVCIPIHNVHPDPGERRPKNRAPLNHLSVPNDRSNLILSSRPVLVLVIVAYSRSRRPDQKFGHGDVDDDIRENIINYDDEGGGEDDMQAYDITPLRIPLAGGMAAKVAQDGKLDRANPNIGEFIRDHLHKVDNDPHAPPFDDLRNYAYEGCGSTAGSLSSLNSGQDDKEQDFNYLNGWGPRFAKLADMYHGESEDE